MTAMFGGKMPMITDLSMGTVDVRDVARLQVKAMAAEEAADKRFIAASAEPVEMTTVAGVLKKAGYTEAPSCRAPTVLLKFIGTFGREARGMLPFIGMAASFNNIDTFEVLQPTYPRWPAHAAI